MCEGNSEGASPAPHPGPDPGPRPSRALTGNRAGDFLFAGQAHSTDQPGLIFILSYLIYVMGRLIFIFLLEVLQKLINSHV